MNEDSRSQKQPKLCDEMTEGKIAVAGPSILVSTPVTCSLAIDCFDEIFDYLSLQDLSAFGRTCKSMQKVAGEYFQRNYSAYKDGDRKEIGIYGNEICMIDKKDRASRRKQIRVAVFSPYITQLCQLHTAVGRLMIHIVKNIDEFRSLNQISFCCCHLQISKNYEYFKRVLGQLGIINMWRCLPFDGDFYDAFLKYCDNLKRFNVEQCDLVRTRLDEDGKIIREYPWLAREYPKLEHLKLIPRKCMQINELGGFFMLNPNVRSFSTSAHCLWINRNQLLNSTVKLDSLEIQMFKIFDPPLDEFGALATRMQTICNLINQLYERGFHKELTLYMHDDTQPTIDEVASMCGLDVLSIAHFQKGFNTLPLTLVRELFILKGVNNMDLKNLAVRCVRLENLYLGAHTIDDILPFIRYSPNLKKIKAFTDIRDCFSIDVVSLNRERKKLPEARKLIIYVPDDIFIETKWSTRNGDVNLSLVELRRADSCQFTT